jgi:hypothetical protein
VTSSHDNTSKKVLGLPFHLNYANDSSAGARNRTALTVQSSILTEGPTGVIKYAPSARPITVRGFPEAVRPSGSHAAPGGHNPVANFNPTGVITSTDGTMLTLMTNVLYGPAQPGDWPSSVLAFESENGFEWSFRSNVSNSNDEAAWIRLADNRIFCVMRHDTGKIMRAFHQTFSTDEARTWSNRTLMTATGGFPPPHSVMPELVVLANKALVLTGGRNGLFAWGCADTDCVDAGAWSGVSLASFHNSQCANFSKNCSELDPFTFPPLCVDLSNWDAHKKYDVCDSTDYIGLADARTPQGNGFVACYDHYAVDEVFCASGTVGVPSALKSDDLPPRLHGVGRLPGHSWEHLPVAWHSALPAVEDLSTVALANLSKYPLVTLEKTAGSAAYGWPHGLPLSCQSGTDPLSDVKLGADGIWRRDFAAGTKVQFNTKTRNGTIQWAAAPASLKSDDSSRVPIPLTGPGWTSVGGNWSLDTTPQMDGSIAMHGPANSLSTDPKHLLANDVFLHVYSEREYRDFDAEYLFS